MPLNKLWKEKSHILNSPKYTDMSELTRAFVDWHLADLTSMLRWLPLTRLKRVAVKRISGYFAATVAAIGISLCVPAHAFAPIAHKSLDPKAFARLYISDDKQYQCILKLYTLESNWNAKAHNKSGAWGIPQMLNPMLKDMSGNMQVWYGMKYIRHRYGVDADSNPLACIALDHLMKYGWH